MAFCRGDEADGAMTMLVVVPRGKGADPLPCREETFKRPLRIDRAVFQGLEQRLRERIIVADRRATERGHDAQGLQGREHGGAFHRAAVVGVQHHLVGRNVFPRTNVAHHLASQLTAFGLIDLPADDLSAKNVHEQIQVKVEALDRCRQIGDVPTEQLGRCGGAERPRLVTLL